MRRHGEISSLRLAHRTVRGVATESEQILHYHRHLLFTAGATTSVSPGLLTLQGAAGNLLKVRSTVPGTPAKLNLLGTQNIRYVDVADNHGTGLTLAPGLPSASNSVNSGNVFNWFDVLPIIPALSAAGLIVLSLLVVGHGLHGRRSAQLTASGNRAHR